MERGRGLAVAGVLALAAVDVVLVAWALRPADVGAELGLRAVLDSVTTRSTDGSTASPGPAGQAAGSSAGASSTPDPSASGGASPAAGAGAGGGTPLEVVLAAVDGDTAWLAESGTCRAPGPVHVTRDGGRTWSTQDAPGAVLRIRPTSAREAFVTGAGQGCDLALWSSGDGGGTWQPGDVSRAWSRVPEAPRAVHAADGEVVRACGGTRAVLDLAPVDADRADVACSDGTVRTTADGGESWSRLYGVDGLVAFGLTGAAEGVAAVTDEDCGGLRVVPLASDGPTDDGTCVEGSPEPSRTAVAASPDGLWLVVGDTVLRAPDAGGPWVATEASPLG